LDDNWTTEGVMGWQVSGYQAIVEAHIEAVSKADLNHISCGNGENMQWHVAAFLA